jgi:hypothetical protein
VSHVGLRRLRKGLLGDLSTLVRIAKQLQEVLQGQYPPTAVYELLDELVLKAFKVVTRAVRFLDIWSQDVDDESLLNLQVTAPNNRPPTPPGENASQIQSASVAGAEREGNTSGTISAATDAVRYSVNSTYTSTELGTASVSGESQGSQNIDLSDRRASRSESTFTKIGRGSTGTQYSTANSQPVLSPRASQVGQLASPRPLSIVSKRISVSHRLSYVGKGSAVQRQNLASERLTAAHDSFLGLLATFIGLHLQSRSSEELAATTQQAVVACRSLLAIVEEVWARDGRRYDSLQAARDVMYARLAELVQATKDMSTSTQNGEELLNPDQGRQLVMTTTNCIRAAGDCVSKARITIERIGDFEFEHSAVGLADQVFEALSQSPATQSLAPTIEPDLAIERSGSSLDKPLPRAPGAPPEPMNRPPLPPLAVATASKPLPEPPQVSPQVSPISPDEFNNMAVADSPTVVSPPSSKSSSYISTKSLAIPNPYVPEISPTSSTQSPQVLQNDFVRMPRTDSVNTSAADTTSTWRTSMPDGASTVSLTSTRATTPDKSPVNQQLEESVGVMMNSLGSVSELQSIIDEESTVEEQMLGKTFAHELIYNKEGQVVGGSLPALIECLTQHDSTPDNMFVTSFYLTFRLFTTPQDLARALVDRFDYIGDSPNISLPVRLRVYNAFKAWLETHWQPETDSDVLPVIEEFANTRLKQFLPAAVKRMVELIAKVSEHQDGALVPRLVSALGKTSTSVTVFSAADSQIPTPNVTKSQLNALRQARVGGAPCSIMDFDAMELARQFTIIESRIFCSIGPEELLAQEWSKKTDSRAVNVLAMSRLSTELARLVVDTILQFEEPKKRAAIIKHWVKVCMKCLELNNYDSVMAIKCSLDGVAVSRLKKTWEILSQKTKNRLDEIRKIVDISRNYAPLRERLKNHVAPCLPFVGMYLQDLTFVNEGNPLVRELPGSEPRFEVINFDRYVKTARVIGELQRFQVPYRLAAVPEMQEWMESQIQRVRGSEEISVQKYYRRSLLLEPRENQPVRPHWYSQVNQPQSQVAVPTLAQQQTETPGHSSKESVGTISTKERFDIFGTLHIRERERQNSQ